MTIKPEIIVTENPKDLAQKGAEIFCLSADRCMKQKRPFRVAVSGGSTPRALHRILATEPCVNRKFWCGTHIFWVDERILPAGHPASNFGAARKDFLEKVLINRVATWRKPQLVWHSSALRYKKKPER